MTTPSFPHDQYYDHNIEDPSNQLFVPPNSLDSTLSLSLSSPSPSFFNVLDQPHTTHIRDHHHLSRDPQQEEGGMVVLRGGSSCSEAVMVNMEEGSSKVSSGHNYSCTMHKREEEHVQEQEESKKGDDSGKWMPSKMRIVRKMMSHNPNTSNNTNKPKPSNNIIINTPTFQNTQTAPSSTSNHRINSNSTTRVCADCNTTTTPLWRGGPKGPKSLCNACGIRQRKARRALMAEGGNYNNNNGASSSRPIYNPRVNNNNNKNNKTEKNKGRANQFVELKNKWKGTTCSTSSGSSSGGSGGSSGSSSSASQRKKTNFAFGLSNNNSTNNIHHQVLFPRDEVAQAALLLMDLSSSFLPL